jgi:hypothetical protein
MTSNQAIKLAQRQQEYAAIRLGNVELMSSYGVNAWRAYNSALEDNNALLKAEVEKVDAEVISPGMNYVIRMICLWKR